MKPYLVEYRIFAVVMAEDEDDAYDSAVHYQKEALSELQPPSVLVEREIKSEDDLCGWWDMESFPYGSDDVRLKDLV